MKRSASGFFAGMALFLATASAWANDQSGDVAPGGATSGRNAIVEADVQVSALLFGGRLKGTFYSGPIFNYSVEGLAGYAPGLSISGDQIYGAGLRAEHFFGSAGRHSWSVAPGLDWYYAPAKHQCDSSSSAPITATLCDLNTVETRVNLVSPTVDVDWNYQFAPHFGLTMGLRGGADIFVNGLRVDGSHLAGSTYPELAYVVGFRF